MEGIGRRRQKINRNDNKFFIHGNIKLGKKNTSLIPSSSQNFLQCGRRRETQLTHWLWVLGQHFNKLFLFHLAQLRLSQANNKISGLYRGYWEDRESKRKEKKEGPNIGLSLTNKSTWVENSAGATWLSNWDVKEMEGRAVGEENDAMKMNLKSNKKNFARRRKRKKQ